MLCRDSSLAITTLSVLACATTTNLVQTMTTINMKLLNAIAVSLSVSMLSACGDSDLEEIHEQELDDAIVSFEAPLVSSALPNSESITPANIDLSDYELVFGDEFNDMTLDANKWTTSLWPEDTIVFNQLQFYVDIQNDTQTLNSPFTLNGQYLTISATPTPDDQRSIANEQAYLSGILSTRDTFDLTFGYICLLYTSPSPRDRQKSRMPSSA